MSCCAVMTLAEYPKAPGKCTQDSDCLIEFEYCVPEKKFCRDPNQLESDKGAACTTDGDCSVTNEKCIADK